MSFFDHLPHLGYSRDLHQQLKGLSPDCNGYHGTAVYQITSIVLLVVSLIVMLNYYYGLFNQPRATHRWIWMTNILVASFIMGAYAYSLAAHGLSASRHCADITFTGIDCLLFSFTVMIYTAITCFLFSLLLKWKSVSNKKIPF